MSDPVIECTLAKDEDQESAEALIVFRVPREKAVNLAELIDGMEKTLEGLVVRESIWVDEGLRVRMIRKVPARPDLAYR